MNREIWANAVLKDGKLIFWYTGGERHDLYDFRMDFLYSGLRMGDEIASGRYKLIKRIVKNFNDTSFYDQFELHKNYKGRKPY